MTIRVSQSRPVAALNAGVMILVIPRLLNHIAAVCLIIIGLVGLAAGM